MFGISGSIESILASVCHVKVHVFVSHIHIFTHMFK